MFDRKNLSKICVVVVKLYREIENDGRIAFTPVEGFVGSLDRLAKNDNGGSLFIDDIINS